MESMTEQQVVGIFCEQFLFINIDLFGQGCLVAVVV